MVEGGRAWLLRGRLGVGVRGRGRGSIYGRREARLVRGRVGVGVGVRGIELGLG
jgi:hypothetical protein